VSDGAVTVFLVRHGETASHAENRYLGRTDAPLTETGQIQAAELAGWSSRAKLTAIVSSTLRRARETANPSAALAGLAVRLDERLVELDFGKAEGLTAAEMRARFPQDRAAFEVDPFGNPLPGGENPVDALDRGRAALDDLVRTQPNGRILVVTHSTFLRILVCALVGLDPSRYRDALPAVRNVSGAVVRRDAVGRWGLLAWNPPLTRTTDTWT
jgi:broad specificity phosphatase PhoE